MDQAHPRLVGRTRWTGWRGLAWIAGGLAAAAAAIIGAVLAVIFTFAVAVMALLTAAVVGLGTLALRGRRAVRPAPADGVIEARNVGGHSWVAYGWDQRSR
jgi:hypothetical protein